MSTDTVFVHKAWHDTSPFIKKVKFPMLADPDGILKAFEMHDNSIGRSAKELLRKLQAAIFVREHKGEVCPASWKPGKKTLKPGLNFVGKI